MKKTFWEEHYLMIRDFFNMPKPLPNFFPLLESDLPKKNITLDKYSLNDIDIKIKKLNQEFDILSKRLKKPCRKVKKHAYVEIAASKDTILQYHELNNRNKMYYSAFIEKTKSLYYKYAIFNLQYFKLNYELKNIVKKIQILLDEKKNINFNLEENEEVLREAFYKLLKKKKEMQFLNEEFLEYRLKVKKLIFEIKNKKKTFFIKPMIESAMIRMTKPLIKVYKEIDKEYQEDMENPFFFTFKKKNVKIRFRKEIQEREYRQYGVPRSGRTRALINKYAALLYRYRLLRKWYHSDYYTSPAEVLIPVMDRFLANMFQKILRYSYTTPGFLITVKSYRDNPSIVDLLKPLFFLSHVTTYFDPNDFNGIEKIEDFEEEDEDLYQLTVPEFFSDVNVVKSDDIPDNSDMIFDTLEHTHFFKSLDYDNILDDYYSMFNLNDKFFLSYSSLLNHAKSHLFYQDIFGHHNKFLEQVGESPAEIVSIFHVDKSIESMLNSYIDSDWDFYQLNKSVRKIKKSNIIVRFIRSHVWFLRINDEL